MTNPLFKLEITEVYEDLLVLRQKGKYLMKVFGAGDFWNEKIKSLNFVRKII